MISRWKCVGWKGRGWRERETERIVCVRVTVCEFRETV